MNLSELRPGARRLPKVAALVAAAVMVAASAAAQPKPADPSPANVQGGVYAVEPAHTQVLFSLSHLGFTMFNGVLSGASGELRLQPQALGSSSVDITVPVDSISTTSEKLNGELKSSAWLDAAKFPSMHYHADRITRTGPSTATIGGELTLHGVTRPLQLQARFIGAGVDFVDKAYTAGFQATGTLKRSAFGVNNGVPFIGDDVSLTINAAFEKHGA